MQTPRLSAHIESYRYPDGTIALEDIRLDIYQGEFCGILGANGSGKSTLLKLLDGIIKAGSGRILLDGTDITRLTPKKIYSKIGLVFQNPDDQLFAHSVFEDVAFGPRNMGCLEPDVRQRVEQALLAVEMQETAAKDIHHLSYGQKKRVCIAGLLAMGHEILLMDEPTAGLDPIGEYRMMELLARLNRESGVTIVMATHSIDLVPLFLTKLHVLCKGRHLLSGTPEKVFRSGDELYDLKLRLPYVAELLDKLRTCDQRPVKRLPLSVEAARQELLHLLKSC